MDLTSREGVRVWAPSCSRVDLVLYGTDGAEVCRHAMTAEAAGEPGGWWFVDPGEENRCHTREAGHEASRLDHTLIPDHALSLDYAFSLDGGTPRPDPRSGSQPFGIDGPSRRVDHAAYEWSASEQSWGGIGLVGAVLYEMHVGTFTPEGTFDAAIDRLDHVVRLGADAVEVMPVAEFSGDHGWGYDGVDLFAPHHAYGGPHAMKRFVEAAHEKGIGVVLDVVYNHLGPAGNYLSEFAPYFTARHSTNWGDGVNFDGPMSDEVRSFVVDNALMWLRDYHVDGLRLDAVHAIADDGAVHILEELSAAVAAYSAEAGKLFFLIAESDRNDPRFVRSRSENGYGIDSQWADEFHHALHAVTTGERSGYYEDFGPLDLLARACRQAWVYTGDYSPYRKRRHGRPPDGLLPKQFVTFLQNHDQVGNRARGERIAVLAGLAKARVAAALSLLAPFVTLVFQGEEWAASAPFLYFTDHRDEELGRAVSEGRSHEFADFGWQPADVPDPQARATFELSKLDWSELDQPDHRDMFEWYRELIRLRSELPDLAAGGLRLTTTALDETDGWLRVERGSLVVVAHFGSGWSAVPLPATNGPAGYEIRLASRRAEVESGMIRMPPESVAVLTRAD